MADQPKDRPTADQPRERASTTPTTAPMPGETLVQPEYVVQHTNVGGSFHKGDVIPHGTYSEEQLARLVELGAVAMRDPEGVPAAAVADLPASSREFKDAETARAVAAAGGEAEPPPPPSRTRQ